ncbi:MAG TPA: class I SAM-dependent methyltransferase [Candidatus Sulfotelmatobacter sp.]|nr:class I SAM-dependent methyltransferase [Candidatus Sulfotelmatobacter sp.]
MRDQKPSIRPSEIIAYYQQFDEDSRLQTGAFQLEFARTKELVLRYLPPPPAVIADVGGGSGVYSCWLASLGYEVHLVDASPKLVEQARGRSERQEPPIASIQVGDARKLDFADNFADAILLLGPLYHLTERADRIQSLREAHRVLRPDGVLCAAAISRFASLFDSLSSGFFAKPEFAGILERDLAEGQHRNPTGDLAYFTNAFFHRPAELREEIQEAKFGNVKLCPVEGPGWIARDFENLWRDEVQRARLLECVRKVESEPEILGASAHLMAIANR